MINVKNNFCAEQLAAVSASIHAGQTVSVIGIPGSGISVFLKQLAARQTDRILQIDVFSLPSLDANGFFGEILEQLGGNSGGKSTAELVQGCLNKLRAKDYSGRTVIIVTGFDKLVGSFGTDFFRYIRSLTSTGQNEVVFVFGICRRLETILPPGLTSLDIKLFANTYYMKPFSTEDLQFLLDAYGPRFTADYTALDKLIELSGGHFQFLQLLLQSESRLAPAQDPFIRLAFENIWSYLSTQQKNQLRKVASGRPTKLDEFLVKVGMVNNHQATPQLFSPLFAECIRLLAAPINLPAKEKRLLSLLKNSQGRVVSKREIYHTVWQGEDIGSEWALNALIYRLRRHPAFMAKGYTIENHKKLGYRLLA